MIGSVQPLGTKFSSEWNFPEGRPYQNPAIEGKDKTVSESEDECIFFVCCSLIERDLHIFTSE